MSTNTLNLPRLRSEFFAGIETGELSPVIADLCEELSVAEATVKYGWTSQVPRFRERIGSLEVSRLKGKQISLTNKRHEAAIAVDKDDFRRDQTGSVSRRMGELIEAAQILRWELLVDIMNNGNSSAYLAYDGANYFSASHGEDSSGTIKNLLTGSEVADLSAVATPAAPTPEELVSAILGCIGYAMNFKDDRGRSMMRMARRWLVVVPANMWASGVTAVHANQLTNGVTNRVLAIREGGYEINVLAEPELTATDKFFCFRLDGVGRKPFIMQEEVSADVQVLDDRSEHAFFNNEVVAKGEWVGVAGPAEFRYALSCQTS